MVVFVAIAGQPIASAQSLATARAQLFRVRAEFAWDGQWQATFAEWQGARPENFAAAG